MISLNRYYFCVPQILKNLDFLAVFCNIKAMTYRKRRIILLLSIVAFLLGATAMLLYGQGYSLGNNFTLSKNGGLYISAPYPDSEIFINNKKQKTSGILSENIYLPNTKPGTYSVIVAKEGHWPWSKNLTVKEGFVTEARALTIPKDPDGDYLLRGKFSNLWALSSGEKILTMEEQKGDDYHLLFYNPTENNFLTEDSAAANKLLSYKENITNIAWGTNYMIFKSGKGYVKAVFDLAKRTVTASFLTAAPEKNSDFERYTPRNDERLWWNPFSGEIFIDWLKDESSIPYYLCEQKPCQLPLPVFKTRLVIKNAEFFPKRKDVLILAVSNGGNALEIDKRDS